MTGGVRTGYKVEILQKPKTNGIDEALQRAVLQTVCYLDVFEQPVTPVQVWRSLIVEGVPRDKLLPWRLYDIECALNDLVNDRSILQVKWGYYFLWGRERLVEQWLMRHREAQRKWKITRRVVRVMQYVPFVDMIAMSGSLTVGNTKQSSDLDLFVVTRQRRIWLTRLGLSIVAQGFGRRRRYWDRQAPDKICLNHYVTRKSLLISPQIRNVYTAHSYDQMIPLFGWKVAQEFWQVNRLWMEQYVWPGGCTILPSRHTVPTASGLKLIKKMIEGLLEEPFFDWLETSARWLQKSLIVRHTVLGRSGRVVVNDNELAFHPDTKVPSVLERYHRSVAEIEYSKQKNWL